MTNTTHQWQKWTKLPLALAVAAGFSGQASAYSFYIGDVEASLNTTLSAGATWRTTERDSRLIAQGNSDPIIAAGTAKGSSSNNFDDGNLNFDKGDTVSKIVKGTTDLFLSYDVDGSMLTRVGGFLRGRYYYDFELKDESREFKELNDRVSDNASGADLLDAYVFSDWYFGNVPVSIRYGKQVVSWGESTFIQGGINTINPIDVPAIRAPGAELKDALLPVEMLYVSAGITENVTVEAFVQTDWAEVEPDDCGTFFSTNDFAGKGCGPVYLASSDTEENVLAINGISNRLPDKDPDSKDQFGVALRWFVPELNNSEIGLYYIKYNSRLPLISGTVGDGSFPTNRTNGVFEDRGFPQYFIEYPENIDLYGISINTTIPGGWSLGAEYSFREGVPLQWSAFELLIGGLQADSNGPALGVGGIGDGGEPFSLLQKQRESENGGPLAAGSAVDGYDRFDVSQAQFTLIKFFDQVMGASRLSVISEVGATYVHGLPSLDEARYGRSGTFGIGPVPFSDGRDGCLTGIQNGQTGALGGVNGQLANANPDNCVNDGYTTDFSWGYRARAVWNYPNAIAGVNLNPQLAFTHDVEGYAPNPGGNFIEGRKSVGVSLEAVYQNSITADIGYTNFFGGEPFNELTDRDFVSASVSYSF
jgi:hypothetical protein